MSADSTLNNLISILTVAAICQRFRTEPNPQLLQLCLRGVITRSYNVIMYSYSSDPLGELLRGIDKYREWKADDGKDYKLSQLLSLRCRLFGEDYDELN